MDCWYIEGGTSECAYGLFPQITHLEQLTAAYPEAKFILNYREARSWLGSVSTYGPMRRILTEADLPGLASGVGQNDDDLLQWFEEHTIRVRSHFEDCAPGMFLEVSLEEGDEILQKRLSQFLGAEVEWGCYNMTTWS